MSSSSLYDTRYFGTMCCFIYSVVCIPSELLSWNQYNFFLLCWTSLLLPRTIFSRLILPSRCSFGFSSSSLPTVAAEGTAHLVQEAASYIWRTYPTYVPTYLPTYLSTCLPSYSILVVLKASAAQSFLFFKFIARRETDQSQFLCLYKTKLYTKHEDHSCRTWEQTGDSAVLNTAGSVRLASDAKSYSQIACNFDHFTPFISLRVLRQVHSHLISEFSTQCDLALPLSIASIFSFR